MLRPIASRSTALILFIVFATSGCAHVGSPMTGAAPAAAPESPKPAPAVAKAVWHVDFADPRRLSAMIQNVNNMVTVYQENLQDYDVRVVFLAGGIRFVTEDPLKNTPFVEDADFTKRRPDLILRLNQLRELYAVKLEYCQITIEALQLPSEKIISGVEPVRSGVVRISELQHQGFAYLKVE